MMKHLLPCMVLALLISTSGRTQNLILNPSNDEPLVGGEIPGWQEIQGTQWTQRCASPDAYEGSCYFYADAVALGKLQQTIDLTDYAANIDDGTQEFYFSGYVVSFDQSPADQSQIELRYFSETNELLEEEILGPYNNTDAWLLVESNMIAPIGARSFTITLVSIRVSGSNNDGYFDALNFVAIEPPVECTLEVTMTQEDDQVTITATGNGAVVAGYAIDWGDGSPVENTNSSSHTYEPGEYTFCVFYTDDSNPEGCNVTECVDVEVDSPTVECSVELVLTQDGNTYTAIATGAGLEQFTYSIDWGDGSAATNASTGTHTYAAIGEYDICVTYQDAAVPTACVATACETINISVGVNEMNNGIGSLSVYPNPITEHSQIIFSLNRSSKVVIDVIDVLGKNVATVIQSTYGQGTHIVNWNAQVLASGVYFVRVMADSEQHLIRILK